jgi:hypothetical protein
MGAFDLACQAGGSEAFSIGRSAKAQAPERRRSRSLLHLRRMGADAHTARNALLVRCYTAFRWVRPVQPEQVLESMLAGIPAILKIYSRQFRAVSPPVLSTFAPKRRPRGANRCTASSAVPGRPCRALSGAQPAIPASGDAIRAIPAESGAIWSIHAALFPPQLIRSAPFPPDLAGIPPDRVGNHAPERRSTGGKPSIADGGNCA